MCSPVSRPAITKERATLTALNERAFSVNTPTAWRMDYSSITPKNETVAIDLNWSICSAFLRNVMASDTDALQFFHGVTNIIECHVGRETRSADARCHDEPHVSAFEFFIELYSVENVFTRKIRWQTRGQ